MTKIQNNPVALSSKSPPFTIRSERACDLVAREALLDACFGEERHLRTCQRLREGRAPASGLSLSAVRDGLLSKIRSPQGAPQNRERTLRSTGTTTELALVCGTYFGNCLADGCLEGSGNRKNTTRFLGTVRLWHVRAAGVPALLLGPLAVDPRCRNMGIGTALVARALAAARARGHGAVILLGDLPYYARFGFSVEKTGELMLPGAFECERLLGLEFKEGALDGACGMIVPTGAAEPKQGARRGQGPALLLPRAA